MCGLIKDLLFVEIKSDYCEMLIGLRWKLCSTVNFVYFFQ